MHKTGSVSFKPMTSYSSVGYSDIKNYNISGFKGLQIHDNPLISDTASCSKDLNLYVNDSNVLTVRPRLEESTDLTVLHSDIVNIYKLYDDRYLIHYKEDGLYKYSIYNEETGFDIEITNYNGTINSNKLKLIENNDNIYILNNEEYCVIKSDNTLYKVYNDEDTYIPERYEHLYVVDGSISRTLEGKPIPEIGSRNIFSDYYRESVVWDGESTSLDIITSGDTITENGCEKLKLLNQFDKDLEYMGGSSDGKKVLVRETINDEYFYYIINNADLGYNEQTLISFGGTTSFSDLISNPFTHKIIYSIVYNDNKIYCAGYGEFAIYDITTGTFGSLISNPFTKNITSIVYNDNKIYCGGQDGRFAIYDITTGTFGSLISNPFTINLNSMVYNDNKIYCGSYIGEFAIYDITTGTFGSLISNPFTSQIRSMIYKDNKIYCAGFDGAFAIYDITTGTFGSLISNPFTINLNATVYNDNKIYCTGTYGAFAIYDITTGTFGSLISNPFTNSIYSLVYNDNKIYCAGDGEFAIYDITTGTFGSLISNPFTHNIIYSIVYDDNKIYCGAGNGKFAIYDIGYDSLKNKILYHSKDFTTFYYYNLNGSAYDFSRIKLDYTALSVTYSDSIASYTPADGTFIQDTIDGVLVSSDGSKFACLQTTTTTPTINMCIFMQNADTTSYSVGTISDLDIVESNIDCWKFRFSDDFTKCVLFERNGIVPNVALKIHNYTIVYPTGTISTLTQTSTINTLDYSDNLNISIDTPLGEISRDGDTYIIHTKTNLGYYMTSGTLSSFTQTNLGIYTLDEIQNFPTIPITSSLYIGNQSWCMVNGDGDLMIIPYTNLPDVEYQSSDLYIKYQYCEGTKLLLPDTKNYINLYSNETENDLIYVKRAYAQPSDELENCKMFEFYTEFNHEYWCVKDNATYRSLNGDPTYFSVKQFTKYTSSKTGLTGFNLLSDSILCVYNEDSIYLVAPITDANGNIYYNITETKNAQGNIPKDETFVSSYNQLPIQINDEGLFSISQLENVTTTESVTASISENIDLKFNKELNKENILTHNHLYWSYIILPETDLSKIYVYDSRSSSFFYWEIPIKVINMWDTTVEYDSQTYTITQFVADDGKIYSFLPYDKVNQIGNTYYYDNDNVTIPWYWKSQILPISVNYDKTLIAMGFIFTDTDATEEYKADYILRVYRKVVSDTNVSTMDGTLNYIKSTTKRVSIHRFKFIQLILKSPEFDIDTYEDKKYKYVANLNTTNNQNKINLINCNLKYKLLEERY